MTSAEPTETTEMATEEQPTTDKEDIKTEMKEEKEECEEAVKEVTEEALEGEADDEAPVPAKTDDEDEEPKKENEEPKKDDKDDGSAKEHGEGDEDVTMTFPQRVSSCCELLFSLLILEGEKHPSETSPEHS